MKSAERLGYGIAVAILIVGGSLVRTPILNWIVGPGVVVASVAFATNIAQRRANRQATPPDHEVLS